MPPKVAAVTMVYDEPAYLPVWTRHYARQVGADHCYVVDHGSSIPLALPPGMNTLRLPRSPHDDPRRALFVSSLVEALLEYYDWVIHTDVDEIVLADPLRYPDLASFCGDVRLDTVTAIGFDVQHVPGCEPPLDPLGPLGPQRGWVRFTSAMCKPVLTRKPLLWSPGFHTADSPCSFAGLYLFHLHWADRDIGLQRLAKSRIMPWQNLDHGAHQRIADSEWRRMFDGMAALPQRDTAGLDPALPPLVEWLAQTQASGHTRPDGSHAIGLQINAGELWPIPPRFRERL